MRAFEQAAKIFFAGDLDRAFFGREAGHGFIFHFEAFEPDDAEILLTLFPSLALAEFHECGNKKSVSLDLRPKETAVSRRLLFLFCGDLFLGRGFAAGFFAFDFVAIVLITVG